MQNIDFIFNYSIIFGIETLLLIFYLPTLKKSLKITFKYHNTKSNTVWLILIPIFGVIWHYFCVSRVTIGIKGKMNKGDIKYHGDAGYRLGLSTCILFTLVIIACIFTSIFLIFLFLAGVLTLVLYWANIYRFNLILSPAIKNWYKPMEAQEKKCNKCNKIFLNYEIINGLCPKCGCCSNCGIRKIEYKVSHAYGGYHWDNYCPDCDTEYCFYCKSKQRMTYVQNDYTGNADKICTKCRHIIELG
jgi:hypothetical protein